MIKQLFAFIYYNIFYYKSIKQFNTLKKRDISNFESNKEYQSKKLSNVLDVAFTKVPYYHDFRINFNPRSFTYEDFQQIPILTKESIRKDVDRMMNKDFKKISDVF